jgi:hypothetical protein
VHPGRGLPIHLIAAGPGALPVDELGLEQADGGFHQRVVQGVTDRPDRPDRPGDPGLEQASVNARDVYWADSSAPRNTSSVEVRVGRPAGWMKALTGRSAMKSPGAPSLRRDVERAFWREIATGLTSEEAAIAVGASQAACARWFRERGGMPSLSLRPLSGRYLTFQEREEIALRRVQGAEIREIARELRRNPSTISQELRRNAATRGGKLDYRPSVAQWKAELLAQRPKTAKLVVNDGLRDYVQERLAGRVRDQHGAEVAGPDARAWTGRNVGRRKDRRWASSWSPEQIANRLPIDFPDDEFDTHLARGDPPGPLRASVRRTEA